MGGYQDWIRQRSILSTTPKKETFSPSRPSKDNTRKLNYNEQRELAQLPEKLEILENEVVQLQALMSTPEFYQGERDQINQTLARLKTLEAQLQGAYKRWEALEAM